jgi:hypothetical protein
MIEYLIIVEKHLIDFPKSKDSRLFQLIWTLEKKNGGGTEKAAGAAHGR